MSYRDYFKKLYCKTEKEYFAELKNWLNNNSKKFIITANPETFKYTQSDKEIAEMFDDKNVSIVPDGIGVVKAAKILNIDVKERIAGIDIANELLKIGNELEKTIYFFGSKQDVIDDLLKVVNEKYPKLKVIGSCNGYVENKDEVFEEILKLKPAICLVALGIPSQEKLIYKYIDRFDKGIFVGVGGSFDVISGHKKRAPKLFIKLNLEWLYRIVCEPSRLKRFYNNNIKFIFEVKKEK